MTEPRLTTLVQGGGCARKLPAASLIEVLKNIPGIPHSSVDEQTGPLDDAAVVRPPEGGRSLVLTIDVITPMVDDARAFGGIAATNALSDVYAMGGDPQVALSFAGFPSDKLPLEVLHEILAGARDACARARCAIVGGHTIADTEPKCGLAVVGAVDPLRVWSHRSARAGQALVLTKRIGIGILAQAIRAGTADTAIVNTAIAQMLRLNDRARDVGLALGATSCTDVTGFGLLGHLRHIVEASNLGAIVQASSVPLLEGTIERATAGSIPGGTKKNLAYAGEVTAFASSISEPLRYALADAQTSGGLLLCLPSDRAAAAVRQLEDAGCEGASIVGELVPHEAGSRIRVA